MMLKRIFAIALCLLLAGTCAMAQTDIQAVMDGVIAHQLQKDGAQDVQQWIDGALTQNAGVLSEWYVLALSQSGDYDFTAYHRALSAYLEGRNVASAASRQKYALAMAAAGGDAAYIAQVMGDSIGQLGIMSNIYGLHLLNNGYDGGAHTQRSVADALIALQLPDGGWALSGNTGDVDVTAMALQALAPCGETEAVERALAWLSGQQTEDGGFVGFRGPNPESAAQVLTALSALQIDCTQDERFIKNGSTVIDAMLRYRLPDGSFSHQTGGGYDHNATVQAYYSLVAYQRMLAGRGSLYQLDHRAQAGSEETEFSLGGKRIAIIAVAAAALAAAGVLLALGKRNWKNFAAVTLLAAAAIAFVCVTDFQSADAYYSAQPVQKADAVGEVEMTIRCDAVLGRLQAEYLPQDGEMLPVTRFAVAEGDTVYDILTEAARAHALQLDSSGPQGMIYVSGIGHLYEYAAGELSGWVYYVNGESPSVGCDQYVLQPGDSVEWLYTLEMGKDLK